ncbi:BrnA antitoxin family protein [Pseudomonas sp. SWRI92]|uniref:BrnA antitoxin family protein n=1 Tax=Pseudomonas sp. SWRI92 TaxID=2745499 RepID=UPI00164473CA|nr:BrnA antitoxin family protein [Pseudomonas sp. SWRI92]MBC3374454.1 BrnA antitoxin family protein [Pseudomonas sp. SWRI92]
MKEEYDFSTAKRGPVASSKGKTRITIMLDDEVIKAARESAENTGIGYQTVINHLLRQALVSETAHNLAPAPQKRTRTVKPYANGITRSDVKDLEKRLAAMTEELHKMMNAPKPGSAKASA